MRMRNRILPGWFYLWLIFTSLAVAQEYIPTQSYLDWKTIETEHFLVHYHQGTVRTANAVAQIAEEIYPHITGLYQYAPKQKTEFIIRDTEDYSNGGAYFYDNKIEIWSENLDYILRGTHNWLRDVVTHEYTHIISLRKALKFGRHVPAGWLQIFGYEEERRPDVVRGFPNVLVSYPISGISIPVWFAEGVSQFQSSSKRFDYRDSHREMILRDRVVAGNLLDLKQMSTFGKNSIGNESSYNQGFDFVRFLAKSYGDSVVAYLADAASSPIVLSFDQVLKRVTGVPAKELYKRWKASLEETYQARLAVISRRLATGAPFVEEGIGNLHPLVSPDGKKIAYLATGDADYLSQNKLVVQDLQTGGTVEIAKRITGSFSWSPDGRYLVYSKVSLILDTESKFNDIFLYDFTAEKSYRLTYALRARHPDWSHQGNRLVFVVESDGVTNLFRLDLGDPQAAVNQSEWTDRFYELDAHHLTAEDPTGDPNWMRRFRKTGFKGRELVQLTQYRNGRQFYHPRWAPGDEYLIVDTSVKFGRDIAKIAPDGSALQYVLNSRADERYPIFDPATGRLFYASDETGIFNIYSLDLKTGRKQAHTNVIGGAFMPAPAPDGGMFYALYKDQGYKIYRMDTLAALPAAQLAYRENYPETIPDIHAPELTANPADQPRAAKPYRNRFPGATIMPRLFVDYGTVKPGFYVYTNEILNRMFFFGGADMNIKGDYDLFGIFEFNHIIRPTIFIEAFNQTANITDVAQIPGYNVQPEIDINFNLLQAEIGFKGYWLPWKLKPLFFARLAYIFSMYRAKISPFDFVNPADGELVAFAPLRYSYLRGHAISLFLKHEKVRTDLDRGINPRKGRYVTFRVQREWNRFLDDFATDRAVNLEVFKKYYFNRYEMNWEEYLTSPASKRHSLTLRFQGGLMDAPVDSFFHFFAGGLVGLKGYPFYSIEGRKMAIGSVTYRFPLARNLNIQFLNMYFDKLYLGGFYQYGNAWKRDELKFNNFLSDVGFQLRLDTFSWYFFPTRIFVEAAYPLNEHFNQGVRYPKEWKFYFGVLFDFDLRLEKRRFYGR